MAKKQGGLCYDERSKQWRACGQRPAAGKPGAGSPPCCLGSGCCIDCEDLNAIRICATANLMQWATDLGAVPAESPVATALIRGWRDYATLGVCPSWAPTNNFEPSPLAFNGVEITCYEITGAVNGGVGITPGAPVPVGLIFTTTDAVNCQDFAIFFLFDAIDVGGGDYNLVILESKFCTNYTEILTLQDYTNNCNRCTSSFSPPCLIELSDNSTGGTGTIITLNIGDVAAGTNPTINYMSLIIPDCCGDLLDDSNISATALGGFANALGFFQPDLPTGPGDWDLFIRLINATVPGAGTTTFEITSPNCGTATLNINYNIVP